MKYFNLHFDVATKRYTVRSYPDGTVLSRPYKSRDAVDRRVKNMVRDGWKWEAEYREEPEVSH